MRHKLVSWSFKRSQPQRIISRLRETFINRYIVERTNKAEIRPDDQSERETFINRYIVERTNKEEIRPEDQSERETFINRYTVERTNRAEIRPDEQIEKAESCRENL